MCVTSQRGSNCGVWEDLAARLSGLLYCTKTKDQSDGNKKRSKNTVQIFRCVPRCVLMMCWGSTWRAMRLGGHVASRICEALSVSLLPPSPVPPVGLPLPSSPPPHTEAAALANKVKALESPHAGFRSGVRSVNVNILPNNQNTKLATGATAKPIPPDNFKSNILKGTLRGGGRRRGEVRVRGAAGDILTGSGRAVL